MIEDREDPAVIARAALRSLVMRAAECAVLRVIVHARLTCTREPLVLMGDLNDSPHAVTTQMVAATQAIAYDRGARDTALFHASDVQSDATIRRDVAYSRLHQGWPDVLDQIWVSEEFVAASRFAIGDLRRATTSTTTCTKAANECAPITAWCAHWSSCADDNACSL